MNILDPLRMPLTGRQIIEASAGTGKTWTLAALYVRLVIGHGRTNNQGLSPRHILVMTFTEAATAELRERVRKRLHEAALWFERLSSAQASEPDDFFHALSLEIPADQWPACASRLHLAAQAMDESAIYTIHGWSRRMLSSFALLSRDLFEQTHLDNPKELLQQLVRDYWRQWFYPLPAHCQQALLEQLGNAPDKLLDQLLRVWKQWDVQPPTAAISTAGSEALPTDAPLSTPEEALKVFAQWQSEYDALANNVREAWTPDLPAMLRDARMAGLIKAKSINTPHFLKWVDELEAWVEHGQTIRPVTLARFTADKLKSFGWAKAANMDVFQRISECVAFAEREPECKSLLIQHAAHTVRLTYQQAKQNQSVFDFNDLLQRLHHALHADQGELAAAIREQYPVAMVDEFQDTDPWQYQSLDRIYQVGQANDSNALVMIGDPKQAIYSFRGADLNTYLLARNTAYSIDPLACHTLDTNYRSTPALVSAVNRIFSSIDHPFRSGENTLEFTHVHSASAAKALCNDRGQVMAPLTFWYLPPPTAHTDKPYWPADQHVQTMATGFATQMAKLLQQHTDIHPADMAVLVRSHAHAQAMQSALARAGLPSVFLSDHANVYQTEQAVDLWRVLRAISTPRNSRWLRSAMASSLWGWTATSLAQAMHDPQLSDALAESCQAWLQQWQQHGVLPMLYQWMHSQGIARRLLAQPLGERRLTNLLHLGELLQTAAAGLQGPQALLHFLAQQIQSSNDNPEEQKMRLETDAHCVQVITFHKSKGLEYPLVFVPFLGSFKTASSRKDEEDDADFTESSVDEDMRLLYVALTRAERGMWLGLAPTANSLSGEGEKLKLSAVSELLQRKNHADLIERLQQQFGDAPEITIAQLPLDTGIRYQPDIPQDEQCRHALTAHRQNYAHWGVASFSSLTRGLQVGSQRDEALTDAAIDAAIDAAFSISSEDEVTVPPSAMESTATISLAPEAKYEENSHLLRWQNFPKGAEYGSLLHDLLEWQAQQGWPLTQAHSEHESSIQQAWQHLLMRKTRSLVIPPRAHAMLPDWISSIITTPLPLTNTQTPVQPLVLQNLKSACVWPEMEFNLTTQAVNSEVIDSLIQQHVLPSQTRPALPSRQLQGMLTGFMDLVCEHEGQYWVLDYKSNWLPAYDASSLNLAVLDKRYDVQYVLYLLALHRLLSSRLRSYDYNTHIGGAVYVFLRGISSEGAGVHVMKPPLTLITQLDNAFAGRPS
jgi:exodeoxyribonuclease V beta subunit